MLAEHHSGLDVAVSRLVKRASVFNFLSKSLSVLSSATLFGLVPVLSPCYAKMLNYSHDRAQHVLVLRNESSRASKIVADDYIIRRGIRHVLNIRCQDAAIAASLETIDFAKFQVAIEKPLRAYLLYHPGIDFIVLTKGIPLRLVRAGPGITRYSLDSFLAALDYEHLSDKISETIRDPGVGPEYVGKAWRNNYWNSTERFTHKRFGGYLVTRLDGYTIEDAMLLTRRSIQSERRLRNGHNPAGDVLFDQAPTLGKDPISPAFHFNVAGRIPGKATLEIDKDSDLAVYNSDMALAADLLSKRQIPNVLERTKAFASSSTRLMGYVSWGSNDPAYVASSYHALSFAPGALAETAVSTSARTFLPTQGGQSLIADLIAQGVTGVKGYTDEPLLRAVASPSILFDRYTKGWTMAESFYAASALVGWEDIVVGDPLARAYPAK